MTQLEIVEAENKSLKAEIIHLRDALDDAQDLADIKHSQYDETFSHDHVKAIALCEGSPMKIWRSYRKMTLKDVSAKTNIACGYISEIENNKKQGSLSALSKIAAALDVDIEDLISNDL